MEDLVAAILVVVVAAVVTDLLGPMVVEVVRMVDMAATVDMVQMNLVAMEHMVAVVVAAAEVVLVVLARTGESLL